MKKISLNQIHIYTPTFNSGLDTLKKTNNEEFDIDNFLHYPFIINKDGSLWKHGNLYLLSKLKDYNKPSPKTLDSIATDLKNFKEFCDTEGIDYLSAERKVLRPTYLYRSHLQTLLNYGKISASVVKRRIGAIVGFYRYLTESEGIKFKFPLWESRMSSITYLNSHGFQQLKQVTTTDIAKVPSTNNINLFDDVIIDGGNLHPLDKDEQIALIKALKRIENTEMTLAFLIALTTGARMQTVFTLRLKHFSKTHVEGEKSIKIKVGYGTSCDTKFMKLHILVFPTWLYNKIRVYIGSPRALKRKESAKHIFDTDEEQYIFLNNRGIPFYSATNDKYGILYRESPNGNTIRQFIAKTLKKELELNGHNIKFSFHDLRASFGMNLFDKLILENPNDANSLTNILFHIKERLGHSSLRTTEGYLNFRKKHKIKKEAQDDFEDFLWKLIDE